MLHIVKLGQIGYKMINQHPWGRSRTRAAATYAAICACAICFVTATAASEAEEAAEAESAPSVSALAWMTGTWAGPAGAGELEENWTTPKAGSIQAMVRMTGDDKTSMVEVIVIEEEEGTLRLRLQQWDPGFKPRTPAPAVFALDELGENTVSFKAVSEGATMSALRYTRAGEKFTISIRFAENAPEVHIPLTAVR